MPLAAGTRLGAYRWFVLAGKRSFYHLVAPILQLRADAESRVLLEEAERRNPIFRPLANDARFAGVLDRMRRDVDMQRERARTRGLLELQSLIGPDRPS